MSNRFDDAAADWDKKTIRVKLAEAIAQGIITTIPLSKEMVAMEFGCGTGLVSTEIAPEVNTIYGVDSSQGMIATLTEKIGAENITNIIPTLGGLDKLQGQKFSLILMSMTLHHIKDYQGLLTGLSEMLAPNGYLAIADLYEEDGSFHADNSDIAHFGFAPPKLINEIAQYGLTSGKIKRIFVINKGENSYPVFLLTAQKS